MKPYHAKEFSPGRWHVGTERTDEHYPYWVANFSPENMACNQPANDQAHPTAAKAPVDGTDNL